MDNIVKTDLSSCGSLYYIYYKRKYTLFTKNHYCASSCTLMFPYYAL